MFLSLVNVFWLNGHPVLWSHSQQYTHTKITQKNDKIFQLLLFLSTAYYNILSYHSNFLFLQQYYSSNFKLHSFRTYLVIYVNRQKYLIATFFRLKTPAFLNSNAWLRLNSELKRKGRFIRTNAARNKRATLKAHRKETITSRQVVREVALAGLLICDSLYKRNYCCMCDVVI